MSITSQVAFSGSAFRLPGVYKVLFQEENGLLIPDAHHDAYIRSVAVRSYAQEFYEAMVHGIEPDEARIKAILQQVSQKEVRPAFDRELAQIAKKDAKPYRNARDILLAKFSNPVTGFFKSATKKELLDLLDHGKNRFRASAWEYRKLGMWNAMADFAAVCKQHPLMSASIIGAVAYLGHRFPFLGGISGIAIVAWGLAASLVHEVKASVLLGQKSKKAEHHVKSGENLAAVLITGVGYKGIKNGTLNGLEHAREKVALLQNVSPPTRAIKGFLTAVKATSKEEHKTNPLESFLFVSGLFDNVLLPFNWAADRFQLNK